MRKLLESKAFWMIIIFVAAMFIVEIDYMDYIPGDITFARWIQHQLPHNLIWATWLSDLGALPWSIVLLAIAFVSTWIMCSLPLASMSLVAFVGAWLIDKGLRYLVFQPRPPAHLIHVFHSTPGSAFPSTTALTYMATIGFIMVMALKSTQSTLVKTLITLACLIILVAVFLARIALGAHWPSDIIVSYLIVLLWLMILTSRIHKT